VDTKPSYCRSVRRPQISITRVSWLLSRALVMLRYIENVDISFRYRYIKSYLIGCINIDLFFFAVVDVIFLKSNAGHKN